MKANVCRIKQYHPDYQIILIEVMLITNYKIYIYHQLLKFLNNSYQVSEIWNYKKPQNKDKQYQVKLLPKISNLLSIMLCKTLNS